MRGIAKAVGVTPMAIYRHCPDRATLLNLLADEGFVALRERLSGTAFSGSIETRLVKAMETYLDHALQQPRLFELMFLTPRAGARTYPRDFKTGRSPTANVMVELVQSGIDDGCLRNDDAYEIVFAMGALSHGLIMLYLGGRMGLSASGFRTFYRRSFRRYIHGIRA
jgi:AcrR family transcriptional regulator